MVTARTKNTHLATVARSCCSEQNLTEQEKIEEERMKRKIKEEGKVPVHERQAVM
jgi:hypothetical protein